MSFDPLSAACTDTPHALFRALREREPVCRVSSPPHLSGWYFFAYDDCLDLLKDAAGRVSKTPPGRPAARPNIVQIVNRHMLHSNPPAHGRLRALAEPLFDRTMLPAWEALVEAAVNQLVDALPARGTVDLVEAYAARVPAAVIAGFFESSEGVQLRQWAEAMGESVGLDTRIEQVRAPLMGLTAFLMQKLDAPGDGSRSFIELYRQAERSGKLARPESVANLALLLTAGYETAVSAMTNSVLALQQAGQWRALQRTEGLDRLIDELLRFDGPLKTASSRWAARPFVLRDKAIARGEQLFLVLASANRDSRAFERPDELDFSLKRRGHLGFGSGAHYCLGARVARMEMRHALTALARRYPGLQLAVPPEALRWKRSLLFRGLTALPVQLA